MVATGSYLKYYWKRRNKLLVQPSIKDTLANTEYEDEKSFEKFRDAGIR